MSNEIKLCINCMHHTTGFGGEENLCQLPEATSIDMVTGGKSFSYCFRMRSEKSRCGPSAAMFQPKQRSRIWKILHRVFNRTLG